MASRFEKGCLVFVKTIFLIVISIVLYMYLAFRADSEEYIYSRESVKTEVGEIDVLLVGTWRYEGEHLSVLGNPYELIIFYDPSDRDANESVLDSISVANVQTGEVYFETGRRLLRSLSDTDDVFFIEFQNLTLPPTDLSVRLRLSLEELTERTTVETSMTLEFSHAKENYNTLWAAMMGI